MTNRFYALTLLVVLVLAALAQAQTFTTLYNFTGGSDGSWPEAGVIQDPAGNLYGTTAIGGDLNSCPANGCGVVYEVNTAGTEAVLHSFTGSDGANPFTPVARDKAGNIYGTTVYGGSANCADGCGVVFKIDTAGNETVLYGFAGGSDGCYPAQGLVIGKSGTLFGTTTACGSSGGYGTIFKIDRTGFTVLHTFAGSPSDGANPYFGRPTMDESGNLYGVTPNGGASKDGVLFKLKLSSGKLTVLHSFKGGSDGCQPYGVMRDKHGNLYGTTARCGSNDYGTIWKVSKMGKETILHNFAGADGCYPNAGVARDSKGNLYGVTLGGGANGCANGYGALYELSAKSGRLTLLHSFDYSDGAYPYGEVRRSTKGTLFGTTYHGGTYYNGTVWSYVP